MLIEETLVNLLKFDVNLAGIPVYPVKAPQGSAYPYIVYQRVDSLPTRSFSGPSGLAQTRLQFDCWALSYSQAKTISTTLRVLLENYVNFPVVQGIFTQNEADKFREPIIDDDVGFYGSMLDVICWHSQ